MMTDEKILEIIHAHANGEPIEVKRSYFSSWGEIEQYNGPFDFKNCEYRVKRKPTREWWIERIEGQGFVKSFNPPIRLREVIEE